MSSTTTPSADQVNSFLNSVIKGHLSKVKKDVADLGEGIVNAKNKDSLGGYAALHVAAKRGNLSMVKYLVVDCHADVNAASALLGLSPLYCASVAGHFNVVRFLCSNDADINKLAHDGTTAFLKASKQGHLDTVQFLSAQGAKTDMTDAFGLTAVHLAARSGHMKVVQFLVQELKLDVNALDKTAFTPLHYAANAGHAEVSAYLLSHGADAARADVNGSSPLYYAANSGHLEVVQMLGPLAEDLDSATVMGVTPLFLAARENHLPVVMYLTEHGADKEKPHTKTGMTPVQIAGPHVAPFFALKALPHDDADAVLALLAADNFALWFGMLSARFTSTFVVELMRRHASALVNIVGPDGSTPLHTLAAVANAEMVMELLALGANRSARDANGRTFIDVMSDEFKLELFAMGQVSMDELTDESHSLWFHIAQQDGTKAFKKVNFDAICQYVKTFVAEHPHLAKATDESGRIAIEVASQPIRTAMQSVLLWHGRYRITETRPDHMSATSFVFRAVDEQTIDRETGQPLRVALKLTRVKDQFARETRARALGLETSFVVDVLRCHPAAADDGADAALAAWPASVDNVEADSEGKLTKAKAERFLTLVMPLAERSLFLALKQESWAGKNFEEVRHVFAHLLHCVEHLHSKGVIHGDLKPLNIVRVNGHWALLDLDSSCAIGTEPVGHKISSAYAPPEAVYVDDSVDAACVRSVVAVSRGEANYGLVTAHPSYDVWSLGCLLYQMVTPDVRPLFQGGQDDSLPADAAEEDNLFVLAEWTEETKERKLRRVGDPLARNLLAQMLLKDPTQRPTLARVLAHPFLSGKKVARLVGDKPKYDVFLSYRVAADAHHTEKLYNLLTSQGLKVYWDKLCLEPGVDWEEGFCAGLVSSRAFVPLLSRDAINHPERDWQNFSKLTAESKCDNVFLEHRLAIELQQLGLIDKVFPIFIGTVDSATNEYSNYFATGCHPKLPDVAVAAVEDKLKHHMASQALGTPLEPNRTVASVVNAITACQGAFVQGAADATFAAAVESVATMLTEKAGDSPSKPSVRVSKLLNEVAQNTGAERLADLEHKVAAIRAALTAAADADADTLAAKINEVLGE